MRQVAIFFAGAAAVGVVAFSLITQWPGRAPDLAAGSPPAGYGANPPILADRMTAAKERQAPRGHSPPSVPMQVRHDFELALGSEQSDLLSFLQKGTRTGATAGEQFVAYHIAILCLPSVLRSPNAEIPGASGDTINQVNAARARLARRCSSIERIGTDQILRDFKALREAMMVEAPLYPPTFIRARNDAERKVAVDKMGELLLEFGPVALQWMSGSFIDHLRLGTTPFARQIREMSADENVLDYAVYLAMCNGSDICGEGGLFYLSKCSETGRCGGDLMTALFGEVAPEKSQLAQPIAQKILAAIRTGEWTMP